MNFDTETNLTDEKSEMEPASEPDDDKSLEWQEAINRAPRKGRGIGFLTHQIVKMLPKEVQPGEVWEMTMDQVTLKFSTSKPLVYEVFHVLEALLLVTKVSFVSNLILMSALLIAEHLCPDWERLLPMERIRSPGEHVAILKEYRSNSWNA